MSKSVKMKLLPIYYFLHVSSQVKVLIQSKGVRYSPCRSKIINIHREGKTPRNNHRTKPPGMLKNQNLNAIFSNQLKGKSAHNFHITLYQ